MQQKNTNRKRIFCYRNLLVNEKRRLSVTSVTFREATTHLNFFAVEVILHLRFRVPIDEPHQIAIVVFDAILSVVFLTKESGDISTV